MAAGRRVDLTLGHYDRDGIEVVTVEAQSDTCTAPRLRELLIESAGKGTCQLIINLDQVGFPGLHRPGVLAGRPEADPAA